MVEEEEKYIKLFRLHEYEGKLFPGRASFGTSGHACSKNTSGKTWTDVNTRCQLFSGTLTAGVISVVADLVVVLWSVVLVT